MLLLTLLGVDRGAAWADGKPSDERRCFRGLSLDGTSGLLDQPSANPGCAYRMRTASYLAGFVDNGYLLVGDRFRSLSGAASVAATLGSYVELALQLGTQLSRVETPPLMSISQLKLQMKLHTGIGKLFHLAFLPSLRLPGVGQDFSPAAANIDGSLDAIGEVSLARVLPQLPLVLLGQLGYVHDRSLRALDAQDCMGGTVADCLKARLQSTAAYSVGLPRVRFSLAAQVALTLARTVTAPHFVSLNDVTGSGQEAFYVTNDHGRKGPGGHLLEDASMIGRASVVYFDGTSARTVADKLRYANGITLTPDGQRVFVAETTGYQIRSYVRQPNGDLRPSDPPLFVDTSPDNFSIDDRGNLLLAGHPSPLQFLRHARSAAQPAPSEVVQLSILSGASGPASVQRIYREPGKLLSASSVAVAHGAHLLIGGVFDRGILHCPRR